MLSNILETINNNGVIIMIVLIAYFNILIWLKYKNNENKHKQEMIEILEIIECNTKKTREIKELLQHKKPKFNPPPQNPNKE